MKLSKAQKAVIREMRAWSRLLSGRHDGSIWWEPQCARGVPRITTLAVLERTGLIRREPLRWHRIANFVWTLTDLGREIGLGEEKE